MELQALICFGWINLTHPVMMLFGIGALIPLLIHYWHRNNHVRMNWAATHYLKLTLKKVGKRYSILQWLLLALRILILLVLAVSMAAPAIRSLPSMFAGSGSPPTIHVILIDRTLSMQAKTQNNSSFEKAKRIASGIVESSNDQDGFVLFFFDERLEAELPLPVSDSNIVKESIDGARATLKAGRLAACLENLKTRMQTPEYQQFEFSRLHVISDFANRDWGELETDDSNSRSLRLESAWNSLKETFDLIQTHPVAEGNLSNNLIASIISNQSVFLVGESGSISVRVQNRGGSASQNQTVELVANEQVVASKQIKIEPDSESTARFSLAFDRAGEQFLEARIGNDALEADNRRFLTVPCRNRYQVLFVEERPESGRFLKIALDPDPGKNSIYEFQSCQSSELSRLDLNKFDVVVCDNLSRQQSASVDRLKRFVQRGGQLVMFLGDLVDRPHFNSVWNGDHRNSIGLELAELVPVGSYRLDPLEYRSRFIEAFRGNPQAGLTNIPVWVYFKMSPNVRSGDSNVESGPEQNTNASLGSWNIDLALDNGDPLMASRRYGDGAIVVYASSSSSDSRSRDDPSNPQGVPWNANETIPAFPALVQEVFGNLNRLPQSGETKVGEIWIGDFEFRTRMIDSSLTGPDGESVDVELKQANDQMAWRSEPLEDTGFYRFTGKSSDMEFTKAMAVNVDPTESDLQTSNFPKPLQTQQSGDQATNSSWQSNSIQIFQWMLGVVVAMMLLESVAALRFGRSRG